MKRRISTTMSLIMAVILAGGIFSGCNQNEKGLVEAILNSQQQLKIEQSSTMDIKVDVTNIEEQFKAELDKVNNLDLKLDQKAIQNQDKSKVLAQVDSTFTYDGKPEQLTMWVDFDAKAEKPVFREIFKVSDSIMSLARMNTEGKEYMVLDLGNMGAEMGTNYAETTELAKEYQEKFSEEIRDYLTRYNANFVVVTKSRDKKVNDQMCTIYQVKFDDKSFKRFLQYSINDILSDDELMGLVKEYLIKSIEISLKGQEQAVIDEAVAAIEKAFGEKAPYFEEFSTEMNKYFEVLKDVQMVGDKGISIEYAVNKDGLIVNEISDFNFAIDFAEFEAAMEKLDVEEESEEEDTTEVENEGTAINKKVASIIATIAEATDTITETEEASEAEVVEEDLNHVLTLGFKTNTAINYSEDISVTLPVLTADNSFDYFEYLQKQIEEMSKIEVDTKMATTVFVDDKYQFVEPAPINVKGNLMVPIATVAEDMKIKTEWKKDTNEVLIIQEGTTISVKHNSKEAYVNGQKKLMNTQAFIQDGRIFVPIRFVSDSLGYKVSYDKDFDSVDIYTK